MSRDCDTCRHILKRGWEKPCVDCVSFERWEPMTNADRIRAMTDEELAEFLEGDYGNMMSGTALKWLQQPVKEGADHE